MGKKVVEIVVKIPEWKLEVLLAGVRRLHENLQKFNALCTKINDERERARKLRGKKAA